MVRTQPRHRLRADGRRRHGHRRLQHPPRDRGQKESPVPHSAVDGSVLRLPLPHDPWRGESSFLQGGSSEGQTRQTFFGFISNIYASGRAHFCLLSHNFTL